MTNSGCEPNIQSATSTWCEVSSAVRPPDIERKTRQLAMFFSPPGFMGVVMHFNDLVARFEGDGRLERVVTRSGRVVEADVAVVGIGTEPAVHIMAGTGLDQPGGTPVARVGDVDPGVFAVGDVARHEHPVFGPMRVEHFDNALKMGEAVARNMLGADAVFDDPHWFWSDQYDVRSRWPGSPRRGIAWSSGLARGSFVLRVPAGRRRRVAFERVDRMAA